MAGSAALLAASLLSTDLPGPASAQGGEAGDSLAVELARSSAAGDEHAALREGSRKQALEALVPQVADHPYRLDPGPRPFHHRLSVSPAFGTLGRDRLFAMRVAFSPSPWLAYEGSIGHDTGEAVHAVLHTLQAVVRRPLAGRFQPYASAGYGMIMVYPGQSLNADPVTKNALTVGGGLELYIRGDLAIRADLQHATVIGSQRGREGLVAYQYLQQMIGLSFYRTIAP